MTTETAATSNYARSWAAPFNRPEYYAALWGASRSVVFDEEAREAIVKGTILCADRAERVSRASGVSCPSAAQAEGVDV